MQKERAYGTWPSPISAEVVASAARKFGQVQIDQEYIYWVESRPEEGGRSVLVRCDPQGHLQDCVPQGFNVRSRVHEYGGVAYVVQEGVVYCSSGEDGRVYRSVVGGTLEAITPDDQARYADFSISADGQTLLCVRERHLAQGEPINDVVCLREGRVDVLATGHDFYASPRMSPDQCQVAWLSWDHPNMPWDATSLWVASWGDGHIGQAVCIAGGDDDAIFQPTWGQDGVLYFVSDQTGWWNIYRWNGHEIQIVWQKEAEFGLPLWSLGMTTFAEAQDAWVCAFIESGTARLGHIEKANLQTRVLDIPFTDYSSVAAQGHWVGCVAGAWDQTPCVIRLDLNTGNYDVVRANHQDIGVETFSRPEHITYRASDAGVVHAFYYAPQQVGITPLADEKPPLLVKSHGGPTGASTATLDLTIQYWTSRGFAVLDVNYRGSTGFGRDYRRALDGQWGILDVQDCVAGARHLVHASRVDENRLIIRGGSAGGLTTLAALAFYDVFRAGASYYGVSDLASLAQITHKFESQYLNRLMGAGDLQKTFQERSPLFAADRISAPVIFLQGTEDPVVPPTQTEAMAQALRENGVPVACVMFEGEMHGFRKAENIVRALISEHAFYAAIFELDVDEKLSEITIENTG